MRTPYIVILEEKLRADVQKKTKHPIARLVREKGYWWACLMMGGNMRVNESWFRVTDLLNPIPTEDL